MKKELLIMIGLLLFGLYVINPLSNAIDNIDLSLYYFWLSSIICTLLFLYRVWADWESLKEDITKKIDFLK